MLCLFWQAVGIAHDIVVALVTCMNRSLMLISQKRKVKKNPAVSKPNPYNYE